jgi:hypothetical protein
MPLGNLARVFAPLLLRCPFDEPLLVLQHAEAEVEFMLSLFQNWPGQKFPPPLPSAQSHSFV